MKLDENGWNWINGWTNKQMDNPTQILHCCKYPTHGHLWYSPSVSPKSLNCFSYWITTVHHQNIWNLFLRPWVTKRFTVILSTCHSQNKQHKPTQTNTNQPNQHNMNQHNSTNRMTNPTNQTLTKPRQTPTRQPNQQTPTKVQKRQTVRRSTYFRKFHGTSTYALVGYTILKSSADNGSCSFFQVLCLQLFCNTAQSKKWKEDQLEINLEKFHSRPVQSLHRSTDQIQFSELLFCQMTVLNQMCWPTLKMECWTPTFQICIESRCIEVCHESTRVDTEAPWVTNI